MQKIKGLEQDIHIEVLENGLTIYLIPFKNRKNYYIDYVVNFGATISKFKPFGKDKYISVPYGVAHFLEHKMFEQENGEDPFEFFSKYGSDANASTGYKTTSYTVEGISNINENLDYLLTYVNTPYFTEENIEKEKNIIIEEINMYNDEPEGKLYSESSKAIFKRHPMRIDIGGTPKSVKSITKNDLYNCYDSFYNPNNSILFIGGNFDCDEVINTIKHNEALQNKKNQGIAEIKKVNEPVAVNTKYKEIKIDGLVIPKMIVTVKLSLEGINKKDRYEYALLTNFAYGILYGNASMFREDALNMGILNFFSASKVIIDDFLLIEFIAESKEPKKLYDMLIDTFEKKEITIDEVERHKKSYIANQVLSSDRVSTTVNVIADNVIDYGDIIYDKLDIIRSVTLDKVKKAKEKININNASVVIAYPKE